LLIVVHENILSERGETKKFMRMLAFTKNI